MARLNALRPHWCWSISLLVTLVLLVSSSSPSHSTNELSHPASLSSGIAIFSSPLQPVAAIAKKLTDKQIGEIEDQWMEDEVEEDDDTPFKHKRTPNGGRMPPQPGPKSEMGFVTLKTKDKARTDQLAGQWADQLMSAGVSVRAYTIEDDRILFVCDERGKKDMARVRAFCLKQPEAVEFETNQIKSRPSDLKPGDGEANGDADGAPPANDPMAQFEAMQEEARVAKKREERAKRKAKEAKKKEKARKKRLKELAEKKKRKEEAEEAEKAKAQQQQQQAEAQNVGSTQQPTEIKTEL